MLYHNTIHKPLKGHKAGVSNWNTRNPIQTSEENSLNSDSGQILQLVAQRSYGASKPGDIENPEKPAVVDPALSRGLDLRVSRGPSWPQPPVSPRLQQVQVKTVKHSRMKAKESLAKSIFSPVVVLMDFFFCCILIISIPTGWFF